VIDLRITDDGDIAIETGRGDVALTGYNSPMSDNDIARCLAQYARMACQTEKGDLLIAPALGNELNSLIGLPNKPATAALGERLIRNALVSWGINNKVLIETWPEDVNTIAYEVRISLGPSGRELSFMLRQALVEQG
jgi:hypothetical protein